MNSPLPAPAVTLAPDGVLLVSDTVALENADHPEPPDAPAEVDPNVPLSAESTKELLKAAIQDLIKATNDRIPALVVRIQRLRLAAKLYKELESDELSEDTYRELVLLTRALKGGVVDPGEGDAAEEERVAAELKRQNIDVDRATRLSQIFERVTTTEPGTIPDDYEPPDT